MAAKAGEGGVRKRRLILAGIAAAVLVALAAVSFWQGWWRDLETATTLLLGWLPTVVRTGGILVLLGLVIWAVWKWPKYQVASLDVTSEGVRFRLENEARKTLAQIFGGIILLGGAYATVQTMRISQETSQAEQFTRAIEQLGATHDDEKKTANTEVRLGGIYTLERLAKTSPDTYHWTIMEVLTGYFRKNAIRKSPSGTPPYEPSEDVQAVITVLGRRRATYGTAQDQSLDLSGTHLARANLGRSSFNRADYRRVSFVAVNLGGANLCEVNLREADLSYANLYNVDLREADLSYANLSHAKLGYADLRGADLRKASLSKADLSDAFLLSPADLREAGNLTCEQLTEAVNWKGSYRGADLACGAEIPEPPDGSDEK